MMNKNIIFTFVIKEFRQITRDFSSVLIAFVLPLILLFLFGFGINFDTNTIKIGIIDENNTILSRDIKESLNNTKFLDCIYIKNEIEANKLLSGGIIRGYAVIPVNFTKEFKKNSNPKIQIITDGSEPNTAKFVSSYIKGSVESYLKYEKIKSGKKSNSSIISPILRIWYNPSLKSVYFILPGSISIIMTLTGAVLTALVIAREWERGTMEAILTTEITKFEFLISKYIAYFILSMLSVIFCFFIIIAIFKVPYIGSYFFLFLISSLFMLTSIGTGLFISTIAKDQFIAGQMAGTISFMPSMMLSGLIYEIDSMPFIIRMISCIIPAKYYVSSISSLFLTGNVYKILIISSIYLFAFAAVVFLLTYFCTKEVIE